MSLWKQIKTLAVILITIVLVQAQQQEKANKPAQTASVTAAPATAIEGTWAVTPLLLRGAAAAGGSGQFLEFGEAYQTESFLAFWARTGPDAEKDWVLFSWKDDKLTRVLQSDVEFLAPDSRKITIDTHTPYHVAKRLLYFSKVFPHHIYAWDGEKIVKVLSADDELIFANERYKVRRARVLDISPTGKALIAFTAPGQRTTGLAEHDGSSFTVLLSRSDSRNRAEYLCLKEWNPKGYWAVRLLEHLLVRRSIEGSSFSRSDSTNLCDILSQPIVGVVRLYPVPGGLHESWVSRDSWVPLAPDSSRSLAAEVSVEWKGQWVLHIRSHPHLYYWNGEKLSSVAWEESIGVRSAKVPELLQKLPGWDGASEETDPAGKVAHIRIRAIPGPIGGVRVQLPAIGNKPRTWYVPANSTDGKLQQPPRFPVAEHAISLADVISWKENEVLALTEEGLFRLGRTEQ